MLCNLRKVTGYTKEVIRNNNNLHRLTISPPSQKVTIKLSVHACPQEKLRVLDFFDYIINTIELTSRHTLRGSMYPGDTHIQLKNDKKKDILVFIRDIEEE